MNRGRGCCLGQAGIVVILLRRDRVCFEYSRTPSGLVIRLIDTCDVLEVFLPVMNFTHQLPPCQALS